jgi:site-specific recombinase XerD
MTETAQTQSGLSENITRYLDYLEFEAHFSPLTIRNYTFYLKRFSIFVSKIIRNPKIEDISTVLIEKYRTNLTGLGISTKTLGFHLIALRSFLKWEKKNGVNSLNAEEVLVPKTAGTKMDFLSGEDVERLMSAPDLGSIQGKRDKAMMELIYSTGLRVSELSNLDRDSIDLIKKEINIIKNGKKQRSIFLSLRAIGWIENYLNSRKDKAKPLFIHHKGSMDGDARLTVRSIQRAILKYKKKAAITSEVTPKTLRSSFAVDLLLAGADIRSVQEMLGHKNISTTQIYTHVTNKQLRDVHAAFHGKGGS